MRKFFLVALGILIILALTKAGVFYYKNLRGIGPAINKPPENITEKIADNPPVTEINTTTGIRETKVGPLTLPEGFEIEIFADNLPGARVMAFDQNGTLWISQTKEGKISFVDFRNGMIESQYAVFEKLNNPHGLAFDPGDGKTLYFAEENKISKVYIGCITDRAPCEAFPPQKIIDLPSGGRHTTRTIGFGPDGRLYVSIGSSCDVCNEDDPRQAAIYSMNKDGSDFKPFAKGLRNSVFFTWFPDLTAVLQSGAPGIWEEPKMWATEMGRDHLGDDLPPDEINIIGSPLINSDQNSVPNFGWPTCYGRNIHDTVFDKNIYIRNPCMEPFETGSFIDIPAHSSPLGLAFIPENSNWPNKNTLLVAYHGSWNRTEPTGYKIVQWFLNPYITNDPTKHLREFPGFSDFISGWLTDDGKALGRPVDLVFDNQSNLYISDDKAGVIYRVAYNSQPTTNN